MHTRAKYDGVPQHDIVGARCARYTLRRIGGELFEVTDESATRGGRLGRGLIRRLGKVQGSVNPPWSN